MAPVDLSTPGSSGPLRPSSLCSHFQDIGKLLWGAALPRLCRGNEIGWCFEDESRATSRDTRSTAFRAAASMTVSPMALPLGNRSVIGSYSGTAIGSQDTLGFSVRAGVRPMNQTYALES